MSTRDNRIDDMMADSEGLHVRIRLNDESEVNGVIDQYIQRGDSDKEDESGGYSCILVTKDSGEGVFFYEDEIASIEGD